MASYCGGLERNEGGKVDFHPGQPIVIRPGRPIPTVRHESVLHYANIAQRNVLHIPDKYELVLPTPGAPKLRSSLANSLIVL